MAAVMSCCCFSLGTVSMSATSSTRLPCSHRHHHAISTMPQQTCCDRCTQSDSYTGKRQLQERGIPIRQTFTGEAQQNESSTWLMVGCTQPVVMAWMVATASRPPAAPRQCPIMDLVPFILMWLQSENTCAMACFVDLNTSNPSARLWWWWPGCAIQACKQGTSPACLLDSLDLCHIAHKRAGRMSVDVVDLHEQAGTSRTESSVWCTCLVVLMQHCGLTVHVSETAYLVSVNLGILQCQLNAA